MPDPITYNLILTAIVVFGLVYTVYAIHLIVDDASIIDLFWGAGFGLAAISLLVVTNPKTNYTVLLALLPILWACPLHDVYFSSQLGQRRRRPLHGFARARQKERNPMVVVFFFRRLWISVARHVSRLHSIDYRNGRDRNDPNNDTASDGAIAVDCRILFRGNRRPTTGNV